MPQSRSRALRPLRPLRALPLLLVLLLGAACQDLNDEYRRVVLVEKHAFLRGRSVDISLIEAPGIQKLLAIVCRDSTMALCKGFSLDGKGVHPMMREPLSYNPDDVFEAFFGGPFKSRLFGPDSSGKVLKNYFTLSHLEDGSFEFDYEYKQEDGKQKSTIKTRPRDKDVEFTYLFIGAEVRIGVSDPVGSVTSF
ncbi:uncharacterized protein LOC117652819 isoform X2 [Thrips palmi]|uniref:Uncharacterized protein LOC117652819 isoform X2 n=1 Tax=Thrips palmi TaxID=161013 RepID=A0A6P9A8K8_THRPL|nr:uncharacterized protein LOC117652819 isoform X2 [Thrips palmi]